MPNQGEHIEAVLCRRHLEFRSIDSRVVAVSVIDLTCVADKGRVTQHFPHAHLLLGVEKSGGILLLDSIPNIGKLDAGKGISQELGEIFFRLNPFRKE